MVSGPFQAAVDFTGILGAHLHLFLTEEWATQGGRRIGTPNWFRNLFPRSVASGRGEARPYGTAIPSREETGTSSGVRPAAAGNFRGQGHRLG